MVLVVITDFRRADLNRRVLIHRIVHQTVVEIHCGIVGSECLVHLQSVDIVGVIEEGTILLIVLLVIDGVLKIIPICAVSAAVFVSIDEIDELGSMLNIVKDKPHVDMLGNVVFTGFRSDELEEAFNKVGYEVSDNVSAKKTLAVIAASDVTKKVMDARKKLVPVVYRTDFPNDNALVSYVLKNYE